MHTKYQIQNTSYLCVALAAFVVVFGAAAMPAMAQAGFSCAGDSGFEGCYADSSCGGNCDAEHCVSNTSCTPASGSGGNRCPSTYYRYCGSGTDGVCITNSACSNCRITGAFSCAGDSGFDGCYADSSCGGNCDSEHCVGNNCTMQAACETGTYSDIDCTTRCSTEGTTVGVPGGGEEPGFPERTPHPVEPYDQPPLVGPPGSGRIDFTPLIPGRFTDFLALLSCVFTYILYFALPIAVIMFGIGGYMFLTSRGETEKITGGKRIFLWTVVGLIIVILSRAILAVVFGFFTGGEIEFTQCPLFS